MKEEALLLTDGGLPPQYRNVGKVLDFLGVAWRPVSIQDFVRMANAVEPGSPKARLICSVECFANLITDLAVHSRGRPWWRERVHSAFVFAGENPSELQQLARTLANDDRLVVKTIDRQTRDIVISTVPAAFCGVMAGVRIAASPTAVDVNVMMPTASNGRVVSIMSMEQEATFLKFEHEEVAVFLSASREIIDLDSELTTGLFDVRDHALSSVPIVLYAKWAFAATGWHAPESNACLVIDDPLLKPNYGYVNFHEFLTLMKRHRFSTNIAFIPWNWRRTVPAIARLFQENPGEFSLSIHGCDHTRAEFGGDDREWIYGKSQQAVERMTRHESRTGIKHDPVMVFPQGVFSATAMSVLKQAGLIAAVNNDTLSSDLRPKAITVSEVWDVAVMGYDNFPLFTRRYPWEGDANFAFDMLLGKPCIAVIHHDFCSDRCKNLVNFVERLNALNGALTWRSLGEVVRRGYRQRVIASDTTEVEMYGTEMRLENPSAQPRKFIIKRRESASSGVREICAGSRKMAWEFKSGCLRFECELPPCESEIIRVIFQRPNGSEIQPDSMRYRIKTMLRRYLSEARDNYVLRYFPQFLSRFIRVN